MHPILIFADYNVKAHRLSETGTCLRGNEFEILVGGMRRKLRNPATLRPARRERRSVELAAATTAAVILGVTVTVLLGLVLPDLVPQAGSPIAPRSPHHCSSVNTEIAIQRSCPSQG